MIQYCPLCQTENTTHLLEDRSREYWQCHECALVFVPANYHLSPIDEKEIYDQHQNNPSDSGYRKFLNKLVNPLTSLLERNNFSPQSKGLDFGSGPGPTLSLMLTELGYDMSIFDIYYANEPSALKTKYDFITSTEVWEHLSQPKNVIHSLFELGNEKFILGIMTKRIPAGAFENWHYIKDPTHITFFADETLQYIAKQYNCELYLPENDTAIFVRA